MTACAIQAARLPNLGQPFGGGYFAGRYYLRGEERALVLADQSHDLLAQLWDRTGPRPLVRGAHDYMDGLANTEALAEAGSAVAEKVLRLRIGGVSGWHIPARDQLVLIQVGLQVLPDFGRSGLQAMNAWGRPTDYHAYWSSTMKSAGSAWNLTMLPWCVPATNWASKVAGVRLVRSVPIIHEPDATGLPTEDRIVGRIDLGRYGTGRIEAVLEHFINEDTGRFYGRTDDLVAQLASLGDAEVGA